MEKNFPPYQKLDMDRWPRREHYYYYRQKLQCGYTVTVRLDVTETLAFSRREGLRFYGCFLYAAAKTVNETEEMRLMVGPDGVPGLWETVHVNFTVFHQEDKTFSNLWTEYRPDFREFYQDFETVVTTYGDCRGVEGRPGKPANFFCISAVPWLDYTGYSADVPGEHALFPVIAYGKYREEAGRYTLPLSMTISHAAADGYHTAMFFRSLQENLDAFGRGIQKPD